LNLHQQLSTYRQLNSSFYRACDINSGSTIESFQRNDPVWIFDETKQDFLKANVTGVVQSSYSCRSACKKFVYPSIYPNIVFNRPSRHCEKPIIAHFVVSAVAPENPSASTSELVLDENKDDVSLEYQEVIALDEEFLDEIQDLSLNENLDDLADQNVEDGIPNEPDSFSGEIDQQSGTNYNIDLSQHPYEFINSLPDKTKLCSSYSDDFHIFKEDVQCLKLGGWISDEIINFFVDNLIYLENPAHPFHICYTYYFDSLFRVTSYGEIGKYSYPSVRRVFSRANVNIWEKDCVCFPVNVHRNHWITIVVDIKNKSIDIVDSLPEYLNSDLLNFIHLNMQKWLADQFQSSLESITAPKDPQYIVDPIERETTVRKIRIMLADVPSYKFAKICLWKQENGYDCGMYCLLACIVYALEEPIQSLTHLNLPESMSNAREILLNFFRFKFVSKSDEIFNPHVFLQLIKKDDDSYRQSM